MTPAILTAVGWCAAALIGGLHLRTRRRLVLVARASHELRGPLCAARLGLGGLAGEPGRVAAIDLELARAGRALDDLAAAPSGARPREHREPIDLATLARAHERAWSTLAAAHGAAFELDAGPTTAEPSPPGGAAARLAAPAADPSSPGAVAACLAAPGGDSATGFAARTRRAAAAGAPALLDRHTRHLCAVPAAGLPTTWRTDGPPAPDGLRTTTRVIADPLRIAQAVANLVSNAAEHGGGVVRVRVRGGEQRVRIEVADDGPGLPAPVDALVRPHTGRRGQGLAIAVAIAEHHGGRVSSLPARAGARLALDLPAAP